MSENLALNYEDIIHPTSFKTMMRFQPQDNSLLGIDQEKPEDYSIKQFHGVGKTYSLICKNGKL